MIGVAERDRELAEFDLQHRESVSGSEPTILRAPGGHR